ncbi:carboxymuconolactone decarboxylase family protein [Opitutus sp. ER46]|uniref:carboxymuconolactone decarboxylase family protein n=1 Tax=Opitutus sp. ER46 TaxID=2161864 RepID=UPI000D30FE6C|nr:carboxymuconolactone decarboxylase family protein [Opitutus sp. ER46]PTX95666.1 alkylhydroperoxidase [Opitutus sp. ER46]
MIIPTNEETHVQPRLDYAEATPEVLQAMLALQRAVDASGLEPSLLDLVKVRASQINGCAFCLDMHHRDAVQRGETSARLYLLNAWHEAPGYTARERAALRWTEALTRLAPVADDTYAEVSAQFTEPELSRLTLAIVTINGWNRFNVGFRVPPELGA